MILPEYRTLLAIVSFVCKIFRSKHPMFLFITPIYCVYFVDFG